MRIALSTQSIITRRYLIEPGDGTRYNFMIHWFHVPADHIPDCKSIVDADYHVETYIETDVHPGSVIPGISIYDYVGITPSMPYPSGSTYEFTKDKLRAYEDHHSYYFSSKTGCRINLAIPILAACSVLVDEPDNLEGAIMAMRKAAKSREQSQE